MQDIKKKLIHFFQKIVQAIRAVSKRLATDNSKVEKIFTIISAIIFFIVFASAYRIINPKIEEVLEEKRTGIDRKDEHGCLRFEGSNWCESKRRCIESRIEECHLSREQKEEFVKDYLNDNLDVIFPLETRGDRFSIKDFQFDNDKSNKISINFQDNFIVYRAEMNFSVHTDGGVDIEDFKIIDERRYNSIP